MVARSAYKLAPCPVGKPSCASAMQVSGCGLLLSKSSKSSLDCPLWSLSHPGADRSTRVDWALLRPLSPGLLSSPRRGKRCDDARRGVRPPLFAPPAARRTCAELCEPKVPRSMLTEASVARHELRNDNAPNDNAPIAGARSWPCEGAAERLEAEQSQVLLRRWVGRGANGPPLVLSPPLAKGLLKAGPMHPASAALMASCISRLYEGRRDTVRGAREAELGPLSDKDAVQSTLLAGHRRGDVAQAASVEESEASPGDVTCAASKLALHSELEDSRLPREMGAGGSRGAVQTHCAVGRALQHTTAPGTWGSL